MAVGTPPRYPQGDVNPFCYINDTTRPGPEMAQSDAAFSSWQGLI